MEHNEAYREKREDSDSMIDLNKTGFLMKFGRLCERVDNIHDVLHDNGQLGLLSKHEKLFQDFRVLVSEHNKCIEDRTLTCNKVLEIQRELAEQKAVARYVKWSKAQWCAIATLVATFIGVLFELVKYGDTIKAVMKATGGQ